MADRDGSGATGPESYSALHFKAMDATAGWIATAADLVRFADATQGRGVAALLQPQTLALMKQRNPAQAENNYGLGWVVTRSNGVEILS
ncbi:hypothetical protein ABTE87_19990, partial [Acinetobacter baumannii]